MARLLPLRVFSSTMDLLLPCTDMCICVYNARPVRNRTARKRIRKIQASLTAHWHDEGADWRGLAHTQAHHRSRLSDSVKNGNALRTMHNAALPAR